MYDAAATRANVASRRHTNRPVRDTARRVGKRASGSPRKDLAGRRQRPFSAPDDDELVRYIPWDVLGCPCRLDETRPLVDTSHWQAVAGAEGCPSDVEEVISVGRSACQRPCPGLQNPHPEVHGGASREWDRGRGGVRESRLRREVDIGDRVVAQGGDEAGAGVAEELEELTRDISDRPNPVP